MNLIERYLPPVVLKRTTTFNKFVAVFQIYHSKMSTSKVASKNRIFSYLSKHTKGLWFCNFLQLQKPCANTYVEFDFKD
jgi:hypothetical protein